MSQINQARTEPKSSAFAGCLLVERRYAIVEKKVGRRKISVVCPSDFTKPRFIEPDSFPRIAWEFAEVRSNTQLLAFAHKFGLLGFARLFPLAPKYDGDPVEWSLGHARRVAAAFEIIEHIRQGPSRVLIELPGLLRSIGWDLMGKMTKGEKPERLFLQTGTVFEDGKEKAVGLLKPGFVADADWPNDPLRVAWRVLAHLINGQIRGLKMEVSEEKLKPVFAFDALLQVIYWQLVSELDGLNWRRCVECKEWFPAQRADALRCSARCRMRESRRPKERIDKKLRRKR